MLICSNLILIGETTITAKKPEQYRIVNHTAYYTVLCTYGLYDTTMIYGLDTNDNIISRFPSIKVCREAIKKHAEQYGIKNPIILR